MKSVIQGSVSLVGSDNKNSDKYWQEVMLENRRVEQAKAILAQIKKQRNQMLNEYFMSLVKEKGI